MHGNVSFVHKFNMHLDWKMLVLPRLNAGYVAHANWWLVLTSSAIETALSESSLSFFISSFPSWLKIICKRKHFDPEETGDLARAEGTPVSKYSFLRSTFTMFHENGLTVLYTF